MAFMNRRTVFWANALGLALAALGCGVAADEDAESQDQETRVKPKGNEDYVSGNVVVDVPKNAPSLAPTMIWLVPSGAKQFDQNSFLQKVLASKYPHGHIGEAIQAPIGSYDVLVTAEVVSQNQPRKAFGSVVVKGGQTTTLTLPVLAPIALAPTPPKPADLQPVAFVYGPPAIPTRPSAIPSSPGIVGEENVVYASPLGTGLGIVVAPGGVYQVSGQSPSKLDVPLKGAAIHALPPATSGWTQSPMNVASSDLEVVSDGSDFPSPAAISFNWRCGPSDVGVNVSYRPPQDTQSTVLFAGAPGPKKTLTGKFASTTCKYSISGIVSESGGVLALDSKLPKNTVHIGFIDVDDVVITHANGTQRTVTGTVRLSRVPGQGQAPVQIAGSWSTHTALPVVPGTYIVKVDFAGIDGAKNYTETVTIP